MLLNANCKAWQSSLCSNELARPRGHSIRRHIREVSRSLLVLRLLLSEKPRQSDNISVDLRRSPRCVAIAIAVVSHGAVCTVKLQLCVGSERYQQTIEKERKVE